MKLTQTHLTTMSFFVQERLKVASLKYTITSNSGLGVFFGT